MAGSSFGKLFRISTFGESHGVGLGVVIDGCPAGLDFDENFVQAELARRKPGQSRIVTQRKEEDGVRVISGVFEGKTTGTPIGMVIMNKDQRSKDYGHIFDKFRPSHADYTFHAKYGARDYRAGDTIGGVITCVATGVPAGWGEPVFDKLHADLGKAMLSINACKGFEYGSGFAGVTMRGSEHNDEFYTDANGTVRTKTNRSGGIQGGISNGEDIYFRAAFKSVATIIQDQASVNEAGEAVTVTGKGRHDPCVLPRAVAIVDNMTALVLADHCLRARANQL